MKEPYLLLKKNLQDRCRRTAQRAADKLYAAALKAVRVRQEGSFYTQYHPMWYYRTNTLAGTPRRYRKVELGSNGRIYWGGVQFEQGSWADAGISDSQIMENTINRGSHGWSGRDGSYHEIIIGPTPREMVMQAANEFAATVKK